MTAVAGPAALRGLSCGAAGGRRRPPPARSAAAAHSMGFGASAEQEHAAVRASAFAQSHRLRQPLLGDASPSAASSSPPEPPSAAEQAASSSRSSSESSESAGTGPGNGSGPGWNQMSWPGLVAFCCVSVVICYADRSNIATAILPMSEELGWAKSFQGIILAAFFAGYLLTQTLGGALADRIGGKPVLAGGVALWSLCTFLTPASAHAGAGPLLTMRVLLGLSEGVAFPSIHALLARHVPTASQSSAVAVVTAASYAGTALAFGISPSLIAAYGWPSVFYLFSSLALLWLPLWLPASLPPPAARLESPSATRPESVTNHGLESRANHGLESVAPPWAAWRELLGRREVWAICAAQYGGAFGFYALLNWLPTFFAERYHVALADLGGLTVAPYLLQGAVGVGAGLLADRLLAGGRGRRAVRVGLQTVSMLGPAACILAAASPLAAGSAATGSGLISVGLGLSALSLGAVSVSHLDVAPRHAGFVFGVGNTAATAAGLVSVPLTGAILESTGSWLLVFGVAAGHYAIGAALFALWAGDRPLALAADD